MRERIRVVRYHDISCGHRVVGHEGKCKNLHGHNYRITFTCEGPKLDEIGRIIDFTVIKNLLCEWLERNWDHNFLFWIEDPVGIKITRTKIILPQLGAVFVPFNPTAENMGKYLLSTIGPQVLAGTGVTLVKILVEETRKCSAEVELVNNC